MLAIGHLRSSSVRKILSKSIFIPSIGHIVNFSEGRAFARTGLPSELSRKVACHVTIQSSDCYLRIAYALGRDCGFDGYDDPRQPADVGSRRHVPAFLSARADSAGGSHENQGRDGRAADHESSQGAEDHGRRGNALERRCSGDARKRHRHGQALRRYAGNAAANRGRRFEGLSANRPGACRRPEESDRVIRRALRHDAGHTKEGRRQCVPHLRSEGHGTPQVAGCDRTILLSKEVDMTCIDTKSKRHLPATLAAGLAISSFLVLGTFVASASAEEHHRGDGGGRAADHHPGRGDGGRGGYGGSYGGGGGYYYAPPPIVYGSPYGDSYYGYSNPYYAPPVIYGPGIGIAVPGIGITIY